MKTHDQLCDETVGELLEYVGLIRRCKDGDMAAAAKLVRATAQGGQFCGYLVVNVNAIMDPVINPEMYK